MSVDQPALPGTLPERDTAEPCIVFGYDDPDQPRELTLFLDVDSDALVTHWLSMDVEHTVSLDEMR